MTKKSLNEKMLLISIIGTLESLKGEGLSINEAEKYLFSPHMVQMLKENKCNESIIFITGFSFPHSRTPLLTLQCKKGVTPD